MPYRTPASAIAFVVVLVFLIILFVFLAAFAGTDVGGFPVVFFAPFCGIMVLVIIVIIAVLAAGGMGRRTIPPPPPIQQPMVPAGMQGPMALNCPNCGAPPTNVDRFGVATCTYCDTRFLVR